MMKKCHPEHVKLRKNSISVTVKFDENEMFAIYGLAQRYTDGCLAQLLHDTSIEWIKENLMDETAAARRIIDFRKGQGKPELLP